MHLFCFITIYLHTIEVRGDMMKKIIMLLLMVSFIFALAACESNDTYRDDGSKKVNDNVDDEKDPNDETMDEELTEYTLEELSAFDGKNGNKAYIAVDGFIYDVTEKWTNGSHNGVEAGTDATEKIGNAPHGVNILNDLEKVGKLVD